MSLFWTLLLLTAGLVLSAFCVWHQNRPRQPGEVSIFPSTLLLGLGLIVTVIAAAHLVTLLTGVPLRGRLSAPVTG